MAAKAKAVEDQSMENKTSTSMYAVLGVFVALLLAISVVVLGLPSGRLFVMVDAHGAASTNQDLVVNVYEGDVVDELRAGDPGSYPQAVASVTVSPGVDTQVEGEWRGAYTIAIVTLDGYAREDANMLVVRVDKGETHAAFMLG